MRTSLAKTLTLALLGLGNVFLGGANAAPTDFNKVQAANLKLVARAKDVPSLEANNYIVEKEGLALKGNQAYKVSKKGLPPVLSRIVINPTTIAVRNADNALDKAKDTKLYLSDIEMALFVHKGGAKPQDLQTVRFEYVTEKATQAVMEEAHKLKASGVISSLAPADKLIFDKIMATPFGKNVRRLNTDYGAKPVKEIHITGGGLQGIL